MGDDLKPCPWCGRIPAPADISGGGPAYWVECYCCEATGPVDTSSSLDAAAETWNRRPVEDALRARLAAAEAALAAALDDVELERGRVEALEGCLVTRDAALAEAHAELAQARADLRVLAGLAWEGISDRFTFSPTTIGDDAAAAVDDAEDAVQGMPDADVMAAVRRALGVS